MTLTGFSLANTPESYTWYLKGIIVDSKAIITEINESLQNVALLNSPILTADGQYQMLTVPSDVALDVLRHFYFHGKVDSFIGHPGTAELLSQLINHTVETRRERFICAPKQHYFAFSLQTRLPNGTELTKAQLEELAFTFKWVKRLG